MGTLHSDGLPADLPHPSPHGQACVITRRWTSTSGSGMHMLSASVRVQLRMRRFNLGRPRLFSGEPRLAFCRVPLRTLRIPVLFHCVIQSNYKNQPRSYSATQLIVFLVIMAVLAAQVLCLFCGNSHHKQASCRCVRRQAAASLSAWVQKWCCIFISQHGSGVLEPGFELYIGSLGHQRARMSSRRQAQARAHTHTPTHAPSHAPTRPHPLDLSFVYPTRAVSTARLPVTRHQTPGCSEHLRMLARGWLLVGA